MVEETVRTGEVAAGGAVAALIDHYMGPGGNMPEAMLGPAPLVLTAALVLKGVAFVGGNESWGTHVHSFANGLGAAGTYATMMRILPS